MNVILTKQIEAAIDNNAMSIYTALMTALFVMNDYKYDTLFKTLSLEYNPIWNVDATISTEYGKNTTTFNKGEQEDTHTNEEHTDTFNSGDQEDVRTLKYARQHGTEQGNIYGFNTSAATGVPADHKEITNDAREDTDTFNKGAREDSTTYGENINSLVSGAREDKTTVDKHTDTITRSGNIGVTSTQALINEERNVAIFAFYEQIFADIIGLITIGKYDVEV